ncbi:hypothetical protein ILUMI_13237, partial [Ignelater luminosus]
MILLITIIDIDWNWTILTERTIRTNRPDIVLVDKRKKKTFVVDISVLSSTNIQITKCGDLKHEVKQQWKQESVAIVPLVVSSTGLVPKSLREHLILLGLFPYNSVTEV